MEGKDTATEVPRVEVLRRRLVRAEQEYKAAVEEEYHLKKRAGEGIELEGSIGTVYRTGDVPCDLEHVFTYHQPSPLDFERYREIRKTAKFFAQCILDNVPPGYDRSAAIRHVRDAVMTANAGIALGGRT